MAQGGEAQLGGVFAGAGEVGSSGGVVDRGGRDVVEDGDGAAGHQSLRRGRHRVHGALWRWLAGLIGQGWSHGGEFGRRPSGGGELVAGDVGLFGKQYSRRGRLGEGGG